MKATIILKSGAKFSFTCKNIEIETKGDKILSYSIFHKKKGIFNFLFPQERCRWVSLSDIDAIITS